MDCSWVDETTSTCMLYISMYCFYVPYFKNIPFLILYTTYVGVCVVMWDGACKVLQSLFVYFGCHCHPYIFLISMNPSVIIM